MLGQLLSDALRGVANRIRSPKLQRAHAELARAVAACAAGRFDEATYSCERALELSADLVDALYVLGILACRRNAPEVGARLLERALKTVPQDPRYLLAAFADAQLLLQRLDDALALYPRAFPTDAVEIAELSDKGMPLRKAHPDWTRSLLNVTLPLVSGMPAAAGPDTLSLEAARPAHLLNWGLALLARRRLHPAMALLQRAVALAPESGYGHAVLALLYTLNHDWNHALDAAQTARRLGADAFSGSTELCILAGQFGTLVPCERLDPVFEWRAFADDTRHEGAAADGLPPMEGTLPFALPRDALVLYVACDPAYFFKYGLALACSIHESAGAAALHLHFFNPEPELWAAWERLKRRLLPLKLSATHEAVDYDRFGGKGAYCGAARFSRLLRLVSAMEPTARVVMLDADSLVRHDLAGPLAQVGDIGLVHVPHEPCWHRYLAGFTAFRATPAAIDFLTRLSRFLADNLAAGRARLYMDQIGIFAGVHRMGNAHPGAVDHLSTADFCDTLFNDGAMVWSVTQNKDADSTFDRARRDILARYGVAADDAGPTAIAARP
jgi:Tfp pilus assembly protein PilF